MFKWCPALALRMDRSSGFFCVSKEVLKRGEARPIFWKIASLNVIQSFGHLPVITGYFYGIIHSINGVLLVLITDITDKWPCFCRFAEKIGNQSIGAWKQLGIEPTGGIKKAPTNWTMIRWMMWIGYWAYTPQNCCRNETIMINLWIWADTKFEHAKWLNSKSNGLRPEQLLSYMFEPTWSTAKDSRTVRSLARFGMPIFW